MSQETGEPKKNGFQYLDQLKKKKMVQPPPRFMIHLNRGSNEKEGNEKEGNEEKRETIPREPRETIFREPREKGPSNVLFFDKRHENEINRDLVLERLNKYSNKRIVEIKNKLPEEFKIPEVRMREEEPIPPRTSDRPLLEDKPLAEEKQTFKIKIKRKMKIQPPIEEREEVAEPKEPEELREEESELPEELSDLEEEEKKAEEKITIKVKIPRKKKGEAKGEEGTMEEGTMEEGTIEEGEVLVAPGKKKGTRKKYESLFSEEKEIGKDVKINKKSVLARLPKREKFVLKTSEFYMNNRKLFIQKIAELFKPYKKELLESFEKKPGDQAKNVDFKLLTHQRVVRDYLNLYTPYRGLLIYHMLGSGKSCTSIAVAEGMKSQRPVVLMTPASLKMNFFGELKKCGDLMYRRNQYWEFIHTEGNPEYVQILSQVLHIPVDVIQKNRGAWLVDYTKKQANFNDLTTEQQKSVDQQIDLMIRSKYLDINYNGINQKGFAQLTDNYTKNPFDNTTVVIDEAHNFVSRIVNKMKKPKSLSYMMYHYLMKAENARIVLVTGTPIINYPNELGVLFNILRGYIKRWTFQLLVKNTAPAGFKVNREEILRMFHKEGLKTFDYVEYSGNNLVVTRNPFGFINTEARGGVKKGGGKKEPDHLLEHYMFFGGTKKQKKKKIVMKKTIKIREPVVNEEEEEEEGFQEEEAKEYNQVVQDLRKGGGDPFDDYSGVTLDETGNITDEEFKNQITRILRKNHMEIVPAGSSYQELKALPDDSETFLKTFIDTDAIKLMNENTFKKRILGLTSYFRSGSENLMPRFVKTEKGENYHIVPVEMSDYQFSTYEVIRKEEYESDKNKNKFKNKAAKQGEEMFEMSSTYRIFSRAACNFAFPKPPGRPMPSNIVQELDTDYIEDMLEKIDWKRITGKDYTEPNYKPIKLPGKKTLDLTLKEYKTAKAMVTQFVDKFKKMSEEIIELRDSFTYEERVAVEENLAKFTAILKKFGQEKRPQLTPEEIETLDSIIAILQPILKKYTNGTTGEEGSLENPEEVEEFDENVEEAEKAPEEDVDGDSGSAEYLNRIRAAMNMLKYDPEKPNREQYLGEENLKVYSPKFLRILENIQDPENKGLHLLYSQFRTIEGIGILKLVLETNGFAEFKIKKNESSNLWEIDETEEDAGKPRFVLYTGTETVEQKEIVRNIYNGAWEIVPASIAGKLRERASNNFYGEVIKIFMITSSGAEGINLKNTRFVHIVEPYWHMVRLEQVIGRARRIGSHLDLPEEERTVQVFLYITGFSEEQKTNKKNIELMNRDVSRLDGTPVTTDQSLYITASSKESINHQLLNAVKETAIDCQLYNPFNKEENLVCYGFGKVTSNAFSSYPKLDQDMGEMDDINQKKTTLKLKATKPIDGVIYAVDPATMNAYDMDSYKEAQEGRGELVQVGKIAKVGNKFSFERNP